MMSSPSIAHIREVFLNDPCQIRPEEMLTRIHALMNWRRTMNLISDKNTI
jgi:hypothetical protein